MDQSVLPSIRRLEESHWWFRARIELLEAVTKREVAPGKRLLDIGCGTGLFLDRVGGLYDAFGLDASAAAITFCRDRGLGQVRQGAIEDLPDVFTGKFEAVTMWDVLEHTEDDFLALERVRDALNPGGVLILTVPAYPWLWSSHDTLHHHFRRYNRDGLCEKLCRTGFALNYMSHFNAYLLPLAILERLAARAFRRPLGLNPPPTPLNEFLYTVFRFECGRLVRRNPPRYPLGLSILGIARKQ